MAVDDVGFLPVGENDRLVGTITDRDIVVRAVAEGKDGNATVRDVMTKDVKYCFEDEDIEHVAQNMGDIQVRRLPVLNRDKRVVGVVSLADAALKEDPATAGIRCPASSCPAAHTRRKKIPAGKQTGSDGRPAERGRRHGPEAAIETASASGDLCRPRRSAGEPAGALTNVTPI